MTADITDPTSAEYKVNRLIRENSTLAAELADVTAELKEVTRQRDALLPGEGRVVVDALDAEHFYYLGQPVAIDDLGDLLGALLVERVEGFAAEAVSNE